MKPSEFRKLIREEISRVVKEASGLNYMVFSIYPKQLLQALAKYISKQDVKITDGGGFFQGNKKIYTVTFTADSSVKKALDDLKKATDNASKKLIHHYEVKQAGASWDSADANSSSNVENYFSRYGVKLTTNFNLIKFAKETQLKKKQAEVALVNLENTKVMKDIAKGNYSTFDIYDPSLFNDEYGQMMDDLGLDWA